MKSGRRRTRFLTQAALVAAMYTVLCLLLQPISFGFAGVQLRVSEALTLWPALTGAAVPGLFVGCLLANLMGGATVLDVVFGSLTTLAAAWLTRRWRKNEALAALPPVALNAVAVGLLMRYAYGVNLPLIACMGSVAVGQAIACYAIGLPMMKMMRRLPGRYFG